ncbi:MAG: TOBE-like domain-containing protein [Pseudomonadota bacterium]
MQEAEENEFSEEQPKYQQSWISRYPEITGLIGKIIPSFIPSSNVLPIIRKKKTERTVLPGKPVKAFARPHELFVVKTPDDAEYIKAKVIHINPAGSLVKIEMERLSGQGLTAEVPKQIIDMLNIKKHDEIFVRPKNTRIFDE